MASSGIEVDSDLKEDFVKMKQKKVYGMLVMMLSDDKKRVVKKEDLCKKTCSLTELSEFFAHSDRKCDCCYVIYDHKHKLILIKWAPDTAPASKKMIFATTFSALKTAFEGVKTIEATDLDDLSEEKLEMAK